MPKVTYTCACSLDGFLTAKDGSLGWLHFSNDAQAMMAEFWKDTDAILMGRKTWEAAVAQSGGDGSAVPGVKTYLFSTTMKESPSPSVELVSHDAAGFVRELKQQPGKGIAVMSGGNLARPLFEAGVIDEVGLNIHPVMLGAGAPVFLDAGRQINLDLVESRAIDGGCVAVTYRVKR